MSSKRRPVAKPKAAASSAASAEVEVFRFNFSTPAVPSAEMDSSSSDDAPDLDISAPVFDISSLGASSSAAPEDSPEEALRRRLSAWVDEQLQIEMNRLKDLNVAATSLKLKNCALVREEGPKASKFLINRVEVDSSQDFDKVKQLMLSPPAACPIKPGFEYVNVVLVVNAQTIMILPYVYEPNVKNPLKEWIFVNSLNQRSKHRVDF